MSKTIASLFKYRSKWRAQVTLKNGLRPAKDWDTRDEAKEWIADQLANANSEHQPRLGGPKQTSLAQALAHYAGLYTIAKNGYEAEIGRINHYLEGAGLKPLKIVERNGKRELLLKEAKPLPSAFAAHRDKRLEERQETYKMIAALGQRRCSTLSVVDFREFMVCMKKESLSPSTIQKEIALLKHLFNVAAQEWNWKGFDNPCVGLKLGSSNQRFVFLTSEQKVALRDALAECDSPYFWPIVECCLQTTLRVGSLLAMTRTNVDLDGRIAVLPSKTGTVSIPLSKKAVQILRDMPVHPSGRYFPMSGNAIRQAWKGVRDKIGMHALQFRDGRHLGATEYARLGANAHQLQQVLAHKSPRMAQIYVNLVKTDTLEFLDRIAPAQVVYQIPEPAIGSGEEILKSNRVKRLTKALVDVIKSGLSAVQADDRLAETQTNSDAGALQHDLPQCESPADPMDSVAVGRDEQVCPTDVVCASPLPTPDVSGRAAPSGAQVVPPVQAPERDLVKPLAATGTDGMEVRGPAQSGNVIRGDFKRRG